MAKQIIVEGATATNPQTGQRIVYRGGKWFPYQDQPAGSSAPGDEPMAPLPPGNEGRARIAMGLGPAVAAQVNMYRLEGWNAPGAEGEARLGHNVLDKHPIATNIALSAERGKPSFLGYDKAALARQIGGDEYQQYDQAAKSWEAAMLPILSGAAVTPSEAQRQLRANLPQLGDSPEVLALKAKNRAMMTNAAADLAGKPRPFPRVGIYDFTAGGERPAQPARRNLLRDAAPAATPKTSGDGWKVLD